VSHLRVLTRHKLSTLPLPGGCPFSPQPNAGRRCTANTVPIAKSLLGRGLRPCSRRSDFLKNMLGFDATLPGKQAPVSPDRAARITRTTRVIPTIRTTLPTRTTPPPRTTVTSCLTPTACTAVTTVTTDCINRYSCAGGTGGAGCAG
jgi:hypothetical protein